jgi:hypothetical protein
VSLGVGAGDSSTEPRALIPDRKASPAGAPRRGLRTRSGRSLGPSDNEWSRALPRSPARGTKGRKPKFEGEPFNPRSPYAHFLLESRSKDSAEDSRTHPTVLLRAAAGRWRQLSAEERAPYVRRSRWDRFKYRMEMGQWRLDHPDPLKEGLKLQREADGNKKKRRERIRKDREERERWIDEQLEAGRETPASSDGDHDDEDEAVEEDQGFAHAETAKPSKRARSPVEATPPSIVASQVPPLLNPPHMWAPSVQVPTSHSMDLVTPIAHSAPKRSRLMSQVPPNAFAAPQMWGGPFPPLFTGYPPPPPPGYFFPPPGMMLPQPYSRHDPPSGMRMPPPPFYGYPHPSMGMRPPYPPYPSQ